MLNIALGFDKGYCKYASVTIESIISNTSETINFYLMIDDSVNFIDRFFLKKMIKKRSHNVNFINMGKVFKGFYTGNWSKAMYYPIMLSSICQEEKILFLDSDIVVTEDLKDFYNTDLSNLYCAAVHDCAMKSLIKMERKMRMSISKQKITMGEYFRDIRKWDDDDIKKYFNSGMLLLNLNEMRKDNCEEKMIQILETENVACPDQCCFNICFHDKVKIVPIKYNFMVFNAGLYDNLAPEIKTEYDRYAKGHETPAIIHFLMKPWREKGIFFEEEYFKYEKKVPLIFKLVNIKFNYKSLTKKIFSVSNYYHDDFKDKVLTILGFKFTLNSKKS